MPDLISRRELLFASAAAVLLPNAALASGGSLKANHDINISWSEFQKQMTALAETAGSNSDQQNVASDGMRFLKQLDINSAAFKHAAENAYETGNLYWLWQRLIKQKNINGGILNISSDQLVQLHDHPGATGLLRIISGETEVWQFDVTKQANSKNDKDNKDNNIAELVRVSRRVLKAGDTAVLTPDSGNVHALRALSRQCSMLDFFIPPYQKSQRNWYEPQEKNWFNKEKLSCKQIPQHAYTRA